MKRTFEETVSLLIGAIIVSIGILGLVICLITLPVQAADTPTPETKIDDSNTKQTGTKQGDLTPRVEDSPPDNSSPVNPADIPPTEEVIIGGAEETIRHLDPPMVTIILTGNAKMHRCTQAGQYIGFLMADKIIFKENRETGKRTHTIAKGNVRFLRQNIYITSEFARQNHQKNRITFKNDVKITDVQISIDQVIDQLKVPRDLNEFPRDLNEVYTVVNAISLFLLGTIQKNENIGGQDKVSTSVFVYNLVTGKRIAKGGVRFKHYGPTLNIDANAASENAENGTGED